MTKRINGGMPSVSISPTWEASKHGSYVEIQTPGIAPDTRKKPMGPWSDEAGNFFGGLMYEIPVESDEITPTQYAEYLVAALGVSGFHEGLEWVTVNGRQLAEPHPSDEHGGEVEMWDWLVGEMVDLVRRYRKRYPRSR